MTLVNVPEYITHEQTTAALVALGLDHLENDTEIGLSIQELHMIPGGLEVVLIRTRSAILINDASKVRATIGYRREPRS